MASQKFAIVEVSPEMTTVVGHGPVPAGALPAGSAVLALHLSAMPRLSVRSHCDDHAVPARGAERLLTLVVMRSALARLFGWTPQPGNDGEFHLPSELALIAERIWDEGRTPQATMTYRLGKSIELVCDLAEAVAGGTLTPFRDCGSLSSGDSRRLLEARRMIDEEWSRKLTLEQIARACGINRSKLSRGFREMFHCSVSEALADRRLQEARRQLVSTDLPIGVIGYRSGYSNNASFARAFGRRFGLPPSDFRERATRVAA